MKKTILQISAILLLAVSNAHASSSYDTCGIDPTKPLSDGSYLACHVEKNAVGTWTRWHGSHRNGGQLGDFDSYDAACSALKITPECFQHNGSTKQLCERLDIDGICRDSENNILYLTHYASMQACPAGTHLPTIRELANDSQKKGAAGILEVSQVDPNKLPYGYYKRSATNLSGQKDEFFFKADGYKLPFGDLGKQSFWSSSLISGSDLDAYFISGLSGEFYDAFRTNTWNAIRCFPNL